jgi:lipopolysaccharide export system protein LptC
MAILGVIGGFVVLEAQRSAAARPRETPTEIRMINPHFLGRDDHGRAYNLAAREARRDDKDMQLVWLAAPSIAMDVDGPHPSTLIADRGVYREDTHILRLTGHVRANDAKASTVATDEAVVDTRAGTVNGSSPIAGAGPMGAVQAQSYTATDRGDHLFLHGGVHAQLKGR